MSNAISFENKKAILNKIEVELPTLIGQTEWTKLSTPYTEKKSALLASTTERQQNLLWTEILGLIAPYASAREHMRDLIMFADFRKKIFLSLASFATQLKLPSGLIEQLEEEAATDLNTKLVKIRPGGLGKTTSIKIQNIDFQFEEMGPLVAEIILTIKDMFVTQQPIWLAFGIFVVLSTFYQASVEEISQQDASVFWGVIQVTEKQMQVTEKNIFKITNEERSHVNLDPLTHNEMKQALRNLSDIGCVQIIDKNRKLWKVIERYKIVDST